MLLILDKDVTLLIIIITMFFMMYLTNVLYIYIYNHVIACVGVEITACVFPNSFAYLLYIH